MEIKKCVFCGGAYEVKIDTDRGPRDRSLIGNYGINPSGSKHVVILICKQCGHTAIFIK